MNNKNRPDSFLHLIRKARRGRLKIYLGYCAGVGKTYQMLQEAHRIKESGIDVVVGYVETHGRKEIGQLLEGLEMIPRQQITYRGITIEEMDLDAILVRRPGVVLVDELAHTNVPGSKNAKRYQDAEDLLAAGIHVISTLNVQHLESLYETVERITGIKVRERIPDRVAAEADQLVNVDITTEDLRWRLKEGKVYTSERIETALANFFKTTNLDQLRELTLRELAAQIDSRHRDPLAEEVPSSPDQLMVCLSSRGSNSEALLRYTSRLAGRLNRNWYAVYVQTSSESPLVIDAETQRLLSNTLGLAHQLGAMVFTYKGDDIVKTILQFAREYRVGHIVIGSPGRELSFWQRLWGRVSIVERLVRESRGISVVVLDTRWVDEKFPQHLEKNTGSPGAPISVPLRAGVSLPGPSGPSLAGVADSRWKKSEEKEPEREKLKRWVSTAQVVWWDGVLEKEKALLQLLSACCRVQPDLLETEAWYKLLEREQQGGTFMGEDVAIPHARLQELRQPVIAIGVSKIGIPDPVSNNIIRVMVLILTPLADPDGHVKLLGEVSKAVRDSRWRRSILESQDAAEVVQVLREGI